MRIYRAMISLSICEAIWSYDKARRRLYTAVGCSPLVKPFKEMNTAYSIVWKKRGSALLAALRSASSTPVHGVWLCVLIFVRVRESISPESLRSARSRSVFKWPLSKSFGKYYLFDSLIRFDVAIRCLFLSRLASHLGCFWSSGLFASRLKTSCKD